MEVGSLLEKIDEVKYLSQENTYIYRPIMRFFFTKYEQAEYWLYKEEVFEGVKNIIGDMDLGELERNLQFLVDNGSLTKLQDTKNVSTISDFKYHNFRYQMTDKAVIIERMIVELEELEVKVTNLEPRLFERIKKIIEKLVNVCELDAEIVYELWVDLNNDFKNLNEQYQDFLKKFHEAKTEELLQSEAFLSFKSNMINYINDFILGYMNCSTLIKDSLRKMDSTKVELLMDKLIYQQKKAPKVATDFDYDKLRRVNYGKWQSVVKWFLGSNGLSEGDRLLEATENIITKIYKYANSLMELHGNMINRKEEYKHICKLFDKMTNLGQARELSGSVFGIIKCRHFRGSSLVNTDSLISSYDVIPLEIPINSMVKEYKVRSNSIPIIDRSYQKQEILRKQLEKEKERKEKIRNLIKDGKIVLEDEICLDLVERRYVLRLIEKFHGKKVKEFEFGYPYMVEDGQGKCLIKSPDGEFLMNSKIITLEVGE